jgi:hypothetical protein
VIVVAGIVVVVGGMVVVVVVELVVVVEDVTELEVVEGSAVGSEPELHELRVKAIANTASRRFTSCLSGILGRPTTQVIVGFQPEKATPVR